jgi:hypothetical protein
MEAMSLVALSLQSPDTSADVGFLQVLGFALCELEDGRARLVPASGPELWLQSGESARLTAVFDGLGPLRDLEGNPLIYEPPPAAATSRGQAVVLGPVYPVVDLVSSTSWYEKQLGLVESFHDEVTQWAELRDAAGRRLVLAFAPDLDTPAMLALRVRDAAADVERLREYDLAPIWTRGVPWGRMAAYLSPSGLPVLLVERASSSSD